MNLESISTVIRHLSRGERLPVSGRQCVRAGWEQRLGVVRGFSREKEPCS